MKWNTQSDKKIELHFSYILERSKTRFQTTYHIHTLIVETKELLNFENVLVKIIDKLDIPREEMKALSTLSMNGCYDDNNILITDYIDNKYYDGILNNSSIFWSKQIYYDLILHKIKQTKRDIIIESILNEK